VTQPVQPDPAGAGAGHRAEPAVDLPAGQKVRRGPLSQERTAAPVSAEGWLPRASELARLAIRLLTGRGETVAVAESLTGGLLAAALTAIPGASAAVRGGVVAYATEIKASMLGVPAGLLERHGAVHPDVAAAMAAGVRTRMESDFGAATTGVAGPDPSDGKPVGTVYIAVSGEGGTAVRALTLSGPRHQIRVATVERSLELLVGMLGEDIA
jgi:nicotinamide-nucleotide amidase